MCVMQILYLYSYVFNVYYSITLNLMYICSIVIFAFTLFESKSPIDKKLIRSILFLILWVFLCTVYSGINYPTIVSALLFFTMISIGFVHRKIDISKLNNILLFSNLLVAFSLIYLSKTSIAYESTLNLGDNIGGKFIGDNLTFGFNNSNESGMYLYFVITILISLSFSCSRLKRYIVLAVVVYLLYLLYLTNCRTSLVTLMLVIALFCIDRNKQRISSYKIYPLFFIFTPFIFSFIYIYFSMIYGGEDILFLGKPLFSGRETSFINFYEVINSSLVFGNIGNYHFSNMLNAYITIFSNIGLIGIVVYLYYQIISIRSISKGNLNDMQYFAFLSILGSFVISSAESVFFVSGGRWFVFLLTLYLLANHGFLNVNKKQIRRSN